MNRLFSVATGLALLVGVAAIAAEAPKLKDIKCPVSGAPAKADHGVEYKDAQVYFCCPNCPKGFEKNTEKFSAKANQQLVATHQYELKACPFSGQPVKVNVEGVQAEVGFCCKNCLGKYEKASDEEKLNLVFADGPFAKGYEKKAKKAE